MVRLIAMDHSVRTGISLPPVHVILRQKKLMARKFTGVERASIGTTLTLVRKHMSEVQEAKETLSRPISSSQLGICRRPICLDHGHQRYQGSHLSLEYRSAIDHLCDDICFCSCPCHVSGICTHAEQLSLVRCPIVTFLDSIVDIFSTVTLAFPVWNYNLSWTSETSC
jgi:hypothetical protein